MGFGGGFISGRGRRRPFPYDVVVNGNGLLLARDSQGAAMLSQKEGDLNQVAPTAYQYADKSPFREKTQPYRSFLGGMGLRQQETFEDGRTYYCINADTSTGHPTKGPDLGSVTLSAVDSTNGISHFFEVGSTLFALSGRYCHKRTSDADWNTGRKDFNDYGGTPLGLDVVVFYSNALSANYAWIALNSSENILYFDGTTWTQASGTLAASAFAVVGREFYRAHSTNTLSKVDTDADPTVAANWGADNSFTIGDKSSAITRLATTPTGSMYVFKTNGVYTLDEVGEDHELFPQLRLVADASNGKGWGSFLNDVYVRYGMAIFKISPDGNLSDVGSSQLSGNDSEVHGYVTAFLGHDTMHAYAGLYNQDNGNSYLMKYGAWDGSQRVMTWHGSITAAFASKKITALYKSSIGAPSNHYRLYLGFSDGTIQWFTLPCVPNPTACSSYGFDTATNGFVYLPTWHGTFPANKKTLRSGTISGKLSAAEYVQIDYKTDPASASWTAMGTNFTLNQTGSTLKSGSQLAAYPNNTVAVLADQRIVLVNTTSSASPIVDDYALHHALRPDLVLEYTFSVLAEDGLVKRNGSPMRIGARRIRQLFVDETDQNGVVQAAGSVAVVLPDEQSKELSFIDFAEAQSWDQQARKWRSTIQVKAVEFRTLAVYGTHGRLQAYTHGQLEAFNHGQLQSL